MSKTKNFPWNIDLVTVCDQCNRSRAHGNHTQCSKQRQAINAERRRREQQQ